jgi:hypothetical protein
MLLQSSLSQVPRPQQLAISSSMSGPEMRVVGVYVMAPTVVRRTVTTFTVRPFESGLAR